MVTRLQTGSLKPHQILDLSHTLQPTTYNSAIKSLEWCKALSDEFNALQTQGT